MSAGAPARSSYLSIGGVLSRLRPQFPDITISKIRFLEAEGLVEPERSPGGYRQFSADDVERLRFILECQRDRYLPLRVIRAYLAAVDRGEPPPGGVLAPGTGSAGGRPQPDGPAGQQAGRPDGPAGPQPGPADPAGEAARVAPDPRRVAPDRSPGAEGPDRSAARDAAPDTAPEEAGTFAPDASELRLSRRELAAAAGLGAEELAELERYGLLAPRSGGSHFDGDALVVARTVAAMGRYGLEPRHLRAIKTAADREVGLIEQVVSPYARARDGQTRERAATVVRELAALSVRLHTALVRAGLSGDRLR